MLLELNKISKSFNSNPTQFFKHKSENKSVLNNISFRVDYGDCIALLGKNGSGKTTLLKIISGLLDYDNGDLTLDNLKENKISIVNTNDRSFFYRLTIYENLRFFSAFNHSFQKREFNAKADEVVELLELTEKKDSLYMTLSSGEKKKVAFARAILRDAKILLFDEITSNLDIIARREILDFIENLLYEKKINAVIFSTHSLDEVISISNKALILEDGYFKEEMAITKDTKISDIEKLF